MSGADGMSGAVLAVQNLRVEYAGVVAVNEISFNVPERSCTAIIGANGAGKSSILRALGGLTPCAAGSRVTLAGRRVEGMSAEQRARAGLGHVVEGRHIFPRLTVRENLQLGAVAAGKRRQDGTLERVFHVFPDLRQMLDRKGAALSGGQQQFLAIARAMMGEPTLLLLDEPTVGLAPRLVDQVGEVVRSLLDTGTTVLLVEQALSVVRAVGDDVHLLSHGQLIGTTTGSDPLLADRAAKAYLS
jgi:ABC-type branched-subunit amino acid transport system ATPase component